MTWSRRAILSLALLLFISQPALADDWFLAGFAGVTFRGRTGFVDVDHGVGRRKPAFGASIAWLSDRRLGCEGEISVVPGLFDGGSGLVPSSRAVAAHVNLLVMTGHRSSRVRPYGTFGLGAIAIHITDVAEVFRTSSTLPALNVGGGMLVHVRSRVTVRGDLRYFRTSFRDPPVGSVAIGSWYLQMWRGSAGLVFWF